MNTEKNKTRNLVILVIGIILYLAISIFLTATQNPVINGISSQMQTLIMLVLTVTNMKRGLITSCVLCATAILGAVMGIVKGNILATAGVINCIVAIISVLIIYNVLNRNQKMQTEIQKQYQELTESSHAMRDKDEALRKMAYEDSLTGMYNKVYFREKLDEAIKQNSPFTMIYMDIDNFKTINDNFGPKTGDAALVEYADRLKKYCGRKYTTARISGDEFGIIITHAEQTEAEILNLIDQLRHLFGEPINVNGNIISVTVSYGIVAAPRDGNETEVLLDNAIMATYTAKANGKDRPCFFSQAI